MVERGSVFSAVAEFNQLGRDTFLRKYGYGTARDYFVELDGELYDSKAIYGVAHRFEGDGRPLESEEFTGGMGGAAARLISLGFKVVRAGGDPDWTWDEHVLALDLYMRLRDSKFSKTHADIVALSRFLNALAARRGWLITDAFRNINGVYMKLMNFRRFDPVFTAQGKVGLQRGSKQEEAVWLRYAGNPQGLLEAAGTVRVATVDPSVDLRGASDEDYEGEEGAIVERLHRARERDQKLARLKREQVMEQTGALRCEVCDFDFATTYPALGEGFIEVHHTLPVSKLLKPAKTKLSDLAIVCSNCHRMLHRRGLMSIADLRALLAHRERHHLHFPSRAATSP